MVKRKSITGMKSRRKASGVVPTERLNTSVQGIAATFSSSNVRRTSVGPQSKQLDAADNPVRRKLKRSDVEGAYEGRQPRRRLVVLKSRLRYIHQDVIKDKWNVLPEPHQNRLKELFKSLEKPVIASYRDDRKRIEAQMILSSVIRSLGKRLPRMPFPPNTKEEHLDYEAVIESNRSIEQQLTPSLHTIALLKAKILQEQQILKEEKAQLEELKKNAKAEEGRYRRQLTKRHVPQQIEDGKEEIDDQLDSIGFELKSHKDQTISEMTADLSLRSLVGQLQNHLESINSNISQVMGVSDALPQANATIEKLLHLKLPSHRVSRSGVI